MSRTRRDLEQTNTLAYVTIKNDVEREFNALLKNPVVRAATLLNLQFARQLALATTLKAMGKTQ